MAFIAICMSANWIWVLIFLWVSQLFALVSSTENKYVQANSKDSSSKDEDDDDGNGADDDDGTDDDGDDALYSYSLAS